MILTIVQARVSSTRLRRKVLKPILGEPMLARQIERIRRSQLVDQHMVATSSDSSDDAIERLCNELRLPCFRGSLNDVLDRFYNAAKSYAPDHVVRLTADCPLIDPEIMDKAIRFHTQGDYDYASNTLDPSFPDGLDVEVFRFSCLAQAWQAAKLPSQREHVTPFIYGNPQRFRLGSFRNERDLSLLRWTVDEPEDFEFVTQVYQALYPSNPDFRTSDVLRLLDNNPSLLSLNAEYQRNDGFKKSLREDDN